jgi:hypothetical protein
MQTETDIGRHTVRARDIRTETQICGNTNRERHTDRHAQ